MQSFGNKYAIRYEIQELRHLKNIKHADLSSVVIYSFVGLSVTVYYYLKPRENLLLSCITLSFSF